MMFPTVASGIAMAMGQAVGVGDRMGSVLLLPVRMSVPVIILVVMVRFVE